MWLQLVINLLNQKTGLMLMLSNGEQKMNIRVGNAPCSWGVEFPNDPRNPTLAKVLEECSVLDIKVLNWDLLVLCQKIRNSW